jgi:hypothetical protein
MPPPRPGFRRAARLALGTISREYIEQLASGLGLPAVPYGQLEAFAREHGSPVPAGMRPSGSAV